MPGKHSTSVTHVTRMIASPMTADEQPGGRDAENGGGQRRSSLRTGWLVGLVALVLYVPFLDWAPIYLVHDEVVYALNAYSIATSGRGASGELWPLYFHITGTFWSTPLVVYWPGLFPPVLHVSPV